MFDLDVKKPSLLWVCCRDLSKVLDSATWLETASCLCEMDWQLQLAAIDIPEGSLDHRIQFLKLPKPRIYLFGHLFLHIVLLWNILLGKVTADVILFNQDSALFLLPIRLLRPFRKRMRPRLVMDTRTVPMTTQKLRGKLWQLQYCLAQHAANILADGQTVITKRMAELIGVPDHEVLGFWPSGVRVESFAIASALRQWPTPDEPLRLIYSGVMRPERNLFALCDAVRMARVNGLHVSLTLIGGGPSYARLDKYASHIGIDVVRVLAAVPYSRMPEVLSRAHMGVLPFERLPKFEASSPVKLFEYMASEMPVLATRIGCHVDVIRDGAYAVWAEGSTAAAFFAAIREACSRKAELPRMGACAKQAAKDWTWKRSAQKLDCALRRLIRGSS